jgi:hypothetical protein
VEDFLKELRISYSNELIVTLGDYPYLKFPVETLGIICMIGFGVYIFI